jgi:hypothetical protein
MNAFRKVIETAMELAVCAVLGVAGFLAWIGLIHRSSPKHPRRDDAT